MTLVVRVLGGVGRPVRVGRPVARVPTGCSLGCLVDAPGVGRPVQADCPMAIGSWQLLLLVLVLGVLASSSVGCSSPVASL